MLVEEQLLQGQANQLATKENRRWEVIELRKKKVLIRLYLLHHGQAEVLKRKKNEYSLCHSEL